MPRHGITLALLLSTMFGCRAKALKLLHVLKFCHPVALQIVASGSIVVLLYGWADLGLAQTVIDRISIEPVELLDDETARVVQATRFGLREEYNSAISVSDDTSLALTIAYVNPQSLRDHRLSKTAERGGEITLRRRTFGRHFWLTRGAVYLAAQDIDQFSNEPMDARFEHRVILLSQGWEKQLSPNLQASAYLGVGQCQQLDRSQRSVFSFGGIELTQMFKFGHLRMRMLQHLNSDSQTTGMYGSKMVREIGLAAVFALTSKTKLHWDCALSVAQNTFQEANVLAKSPMVAVGASLHYQLLPNLQGQIGYTHRSFLRSIDPSLAYGSEGSMASASLSYSIL